MSTLRFLLGPARLRFLLLVPACVAVGVGTADWQVGGVDGFQVVVVFLGALASHVSANAFNEYFDFRSGLDLQTQRTPFSGGTGTLPAHPELARATWWLAVISLAITIAVGAYFIWLRGWLLLPVAAVGVLLVVTYTTWWTPNPVRCLIAPGLGFGVLMVMGTHFALTGSYSWTAFVASLLPTCLVSDLLLLNQFPDVEADRDFDRHHLPLAIGRQASAHVYGLLLLLGFLSVVGGVAAGLLPTPSLLALLCAPLAGKAYLGARKHADRIPALIPFMGLNVFINLAATLLLAVGLFLG